MEHQNHSLTNQSMTVHNISQPLFIHKPFELPETYEEMKPLELNTEEDDVKVFLFNY